MVPAIAQSTIDGSWRLDGGGSWGTLTNWSYTQSMRPAVITASLNGAPVITVIRTQDRITAINVISGGSGYTTPPSVIIPDPNPTSGIGYPARAKANISGGEITSFTILDQGAGYFTTPTVTVTREVSGLLVTDAGSGYAKVPAIAFNGGGAYTSPPTVVFRGGLGGGATATATVASDTGSNRVTAINVTNGGIGYSVDRPPTVAILSFSGGSGATATATVDAGGVVTGITVTNKGSGYSTTNPPVILIVSPDPVDLATATAIEQDGRIIDVEINNPGLGYTAIPKVIFSGGGAVANAATYADAVISNGSVSRVNMSVPVDVPPGGTSNAVATASLSQSGAISAVNLTNPGRGFTSVPTVVVGAPLILRATATAERTGNVVTQVNVQNPGAGYLSVPAVTFGTTGWQGYTTAPSVRFVSNGVTGAVATAVRNAGFIQSFIIQDGGAGYTVAPTVSIVGGNGTGATATAVVTSGAVTAINVTNGGSDYGVAPTLIFTGGGGSGAAGTVNINANKRVSSITITNGGSGYTSAPSIQILPGNVSNPATATAVIATSGVNAGRVTAINIVSPGSGYTSTPQVVFTSNGVTYGTATAAISAGRLSTLTLNFPGSGYTTAPTLNFIGGLASGGTQATATATVTGGKIRDALVINTRGGADPLAATVVLGADGTISSVTVTSGGNGYIADPTVTFAAPTGIATPVTLGPGGVASFVQFNRDITGNRTITMDSARTVGSLSIGDTGGEDYTIDDGTGGINNTLTFSMGEAGAGKSFLNKLQGDQDVINAPITLADELNLRVNAGRLTVTGGFTGPGTLVTSGNSVLTVTGRAPTGNKVDLWLQHRGFGNTGAQIELGASGGPSFENVLLGNASAGTGGFAVLQLQENRGSALADRAPFLDQISDTGTITVDAVANRWGYFKLMGGSETIGNLIDVGNALVLENMEGETVNTNAVLTLGGNNLDSFVGGFIRNRSGGSGTGTLGITKNGAGTLTLQGANMIYTGLTTLNQGRLELVNTSAWASRIVAATGTRIDLTTTSGVSVNFDDEVLGDAEFFKNGLGALSFGSGRLQLDNLFMTLGTTSFRPGAATLRGGENVIQNTFTIRGDGGQNKNVLLSASLSIGALEAEGRFDQLGSIFSIQGEQFNLSNRGYASEGVLESKGTASFTNMVVSLGSRILTTDRTVQNAAAGSVFLTLTDANNLVIGSILTLRSGTSGAATNKVTPDTRIVAVNLATRTVELSKATTLAAGALITFTYTSETDGAIRGESVNFADVVYDGRKFVAVSERGTIHTSVNGTIWDLVYSDPAEMPLYSLTWTGDRYVAVGDLGRVLTSTDGGNTWTLQSSTVVGTLRDITETSVPFTGNLVTGSANVANVTNGLSFLPGMPVIGNATPPDGRIVSTTVASFTVVLDNPALATATDVNFGYFRGNTTANSVTVTNVRTSQTLAGGIAISGTGIPNGATIQSTDGPNNRITLSQSANTSQAGVDLFTLTGNTITGSAQISNLSNTAGLVVGMVLKGAGIPSGARITVINAGAATLTLSVPIPATRTTVPLSVFTGRVVSGSAVVEDVTNIGAYSQGMAAFGRLLPAGTVVQSSTASTLTLSQQASATGTGVGMTVAKTLMTRIGNFSASSNSVTGVSNVDGLVAGMPISAPGVLPAGTLIQVVGAGTLTLSKQAITSPTGQAFQAGFDLVVVGDSGRILASAGGGTDTWVPLTSSSVVDLNAISWNGSRLVAVGSSSEILHSSTGLAWTRITPPLSNLPNVILGTNTAGNAREIILSNPATVTSTNASFGALKGNTTAGSATVTNVKGMASLRVGLQIFSTSGLQAGTLVRSVNEAANSMVMSSPATATLSQAPIQTFTGVSVNGSRFITEVTDFKGLMVGMLLHGTALPNPTLITDISPENQRITLASPANQSIRAGFGVMRGDLVNASATVSNIQILGSISPFTGAVAHLTAGRSVAEYPSRISAAVTISAYSPTENTVTLSSAAIGSGYVPLYTISGSTTNGSNLITGVSVGHFAGLSVGQSIYVTGTAIPTSSFSSFTITALDSAAGQITLSGSPFLNLATGASVVPLGVFTGFVTSGDVVVRNISNRLGELPPTLYQSNLKDVVWTGSQFIAVGSYGAILTSSDGIAWTPRDSATGRDLQSIGIAGAQFLAAGEDGLILRSTNGTAWSQAREADDFNIRDLRHLEAVKAVITAGGKTLALGNGGLSSTDGTTWSTSVTDNFSGSKNSMIIAGRPGQSAIVIRNEVTTSATTDPVNGPLTNRNNANRIDDAMTLESKGGNFEFQNNGANAIFSETINKLLLKQGQLQISTNSAGTSGTSTLTFGSLEAQPGASLQFLGRDSAGAVSTGSIGEGATPSRNRIFFTQAPTLDDGIIGGWATVDGRITTETEWATYGVNGVTRLDPTNGYDTGDQTGWIFSDNVKMQTGRTLTAPRAINSLNLVGQTLTMSAQRLSIESGGILVTNTSTINSTGGVLSVGTGKSDPAILNIIAPAQLTINAPIDDFRVSGALLAVTATSSSSSLTMSSVNATGMLPGMEIFGAGIPDGTRIVSITAIPGGGNSLITLSQPTTTTIPTSATIVVTGGSVGLNKSGGGLVILNGTSSYTGKTYLSSGTLRITNFSALGADPTSFTQDHLQINGGTLQINHIITGATPLPDHNVNLNEGLRGLTIGISGGRIEVGTANPDNDNPTNAIPEVNLTITNPINALGVLELAVRANTSLGQANSITLGSPTSSNIYRAGIKTEAQFEGNITIRGNNTIGGIFSEGGNLLIEGNNDFTAPIRSLTGDITISGTNTWRGGNVFPDALDFRAGVLKLTTQTALGTGGLNLGMGDGSIFSLAGLSQTIRTFTSSASTEINNDGAPDDFVGFTDIIFDLDRNQTFNGLIKDGNSISGTEVTPLRLIKTGPGTLTLTNSQSGFSAGVEIREGALNVTTIGLTFNDTALGRVDFDDPALLVIDKSVLSFTPAFAQSMDRSITMGAGPAGATLVANGATQSATVTLGLELRDVINGLTQITTPIAFKDSGPRTLTLSGTGRGDNLFMLELGDKGPGEVSGLFKTGSGNWVLGKSNPYSGITTIQEGNLVVTRNDALGTVGASTAVDQASDTFSGNLPNGTPVNFPLFATTTLPGGVEADTQYFVVGSTGTTFQIAATPGGVPLPITSNGAGVQVVPRIDSFRSTVFDAATDIFTGILPNGAQVTFNTKLVTGVASPSAPDGMLTNTVYYVTNSNNGTFKVSLTPGGPAVDFTSAGTPGALYYTTSAASNASGGVNLTGGSLDLRNIDYLTPETLYLQGGVITVPNDSVSSWSGDLWANANSRINIGLGGRLTLHGNLLGTRSINQEGEGTLVMVGEMLAPLTNLENSSREFAVRAGTLVLDYTTNNASKLIDNANLRLGGTRRGGSVVLSGGNHDEIIGQLVLEAGASSIYRESGTSTISLNNVFRNTGSSLYLDGGRIAKTDNTNNNGILGAWAVIRDAITDPFWVIPRTSSFTYQVKGDSGSDFILTPERHVITRGMVVSFATTGTLPGGLTAGTAYYAIQNDGGSPRDIVMSDVSLLAVGWTVTGPGIIDGTKVNAIFPDGNVITLDQPHDGSGQSASFTFTSPSLVQVVRPGTLGSLGKLKVSTTLDGPVVNITSVGSGQLSITAQLGFRANATTDRLTLGAGHGLADGVRVRVSSYGQLPVGLLPDTDYFVADSDTQSIRLSNAINGTLISFATNGSGAHVIETQGPEKRVGPSTILFKMEPDFATASEGNGRVRVAIVNVGGSGPITSTLTGLGTTVDPYVYTLYTTGTNNSNQHIANFVAADEVGLVTIKEVFTVALPNQASDQIFTLFSTMPDSGNYGAPTFLANGTFDNGSTELGWARNAGVPGNATATADGFIMPLASYGSWAANSNTEMSGDLSLGILRNTFSLRFASQLSSTVSLNLTSGIYAIRTGGILVSPTVGANDSTLGGIGRLTTENQGNLQNLMLHQNNQLGDLVINNRITNRLPVTRAGRLTGQSRRHLTMPPGITTSQVAVNWSLPLTTGVNTGIAANTRVENFQYGRLIVLSADHDGVLRNQNYIFASPGIVALNADDPLNPTHPARSQISGLSTTADLQIGMEVTGTGIAAGTTIAEIVNGDTVRLNQISDGVYRAATITFTEGTTIINRLALINDPNRFLITGLTSTENLVIGMNVSGPGISFGTTIEEVSASPAYVRLSKIHDGTHRFGASFTFTGGALPPEGVTRVANLPVTLAFAGSSNDPNRRILDGVSSVQGLLAGMTVTGAGLPAGTLVDFIIDNHTVYLNQNHDGAFRRGSYTFAGGGLPSGGTARIASVPDAYRRRVMGIVIPASGPTPSSVSCTDLYLGMPISGPGIPFGSTITNIYNESDIEVSSNHFFTSETTTLVFTPTIGVEKLGAGMAALTGVSDYTGVTFIADGTLRIGQLTDGGVAGSLGASSGAAGNLVFNGGALQFVGENSQTNRGFTVAEFATLNIGHERTVATFSGSIASGLDRLQKDGPGTLRLNGNANLGAMRMDQGRLLLDTVDTNPAPGTFSPSNFSQSNLTSLILGGGVLEVRGAREGNVNQNFGAQLTIDAGATTVKVTSVEGYDPNNLLALPPFRSAALTMMGQEELTDVLRNAGGSVHFLENLEGKDAGAANIFLLLPQEDRQRLMPWATYQTSTDTNRPGVNHFASVESNTGAVISADTASLYDLGPKFVDPVNWEATRNFARTLNVSEGASDSNGVPLALNGTISANRYANILRYTTTADGTLNIDAGKTLELVGGAILAATSIYQGQKVIAGPGSLTGGVRNETNNDFIMHNYNASAPFTISAKIVNRSIQAASTSGASGKGNLKAGETQLKISSTGPALTGDFYVHVRAGMFVSGPGIQAGTVVTAVERSFGRLIISLPALSDQTNQIYTFTETTNFIQTGVGTTILAGDNTYSGNTYVHGGVLRLNSAGAVPGGIGATGGTSALIVEGGVIGLGAGDFTRLLGSSASQVNFTGSGGFAAFGADRTVNLGGSAVPEPLRYGNNGFVPDGASLILGSSDATHKLIFANPIDLSAFSQAIRVNDGPAAVEAELSGGLSGLGRMIKFGLGTLRLGVSNAQTGGIEIAEGRLIAANVTNVFGTSAGSVRIGTSLTNTTSLAAVNLQIEGGTVANPLQVGSVNARGGEWVSGGVVENSQAANNVGEEASAAVIDQYPAIAYYDLTNQDLKYVRALDARGTSWGPPVTVAGQGRTGRNPSLDIINGNPAITYHDDSTGLLMYVRANDAQGVTWGTPVSILGQSTPVLAVALQSDGKVIVGGSFTKFDGLNRNRLIRLNTDGSVDDTFNAFVMNGEVRTILVLPDGKILAGGTFTAVRVDANAASDTVRNRLARFNANGSLDTTLSPDVNSDVRVLVQQTDGKIMMGGSFTTVSGVGITRLARLTSNATLDTSFTSPDIRNGEVRAIIPENTDADPEMESYIIGGSFTDVRGTGNRNRLARINSDASLTTFNPNANNVVFDMVLLASGKLLVGGAFTGFTDGAGNFIARTRLARLNTNGTVDEVFGQEVNNEVRDLHLETNGNVLVAGVFTQLGDFARRGLGRVLVDGTVDATYAPEPDNEVRSMVTLPDGKLIIGGIFNNAGGITQQLVGRLEVGGAADIGFDRNILDVGLYTSLKSINGNPALAFYDSKNQDVYYIRSTDVNGVGWPNPELIDSTGNVGVGVCLAVANIGGDVLTRDNRGTQDLVDDEVTISGVANIGTPTVAYGDATNSRIKIAVADNANGFGFSGVGLSLPVRNWSLPVTIPGTGDVGRHFSLTVVDGFPSVVYQSSDTLDLKFIRALNVAGITNNLRDPADLSIRRMPVSTLGFSSTGSWDAPITLDSSSGNVGAYPSVAFVNGQPTTSKSRPAVSYYDATNGDLKYVSATDSTGSIWNAPVSLLTVEDVGRANTLLVTDNLPAVAYHNATSGDLGFIILNNASGYSRIASTGDTTWTGSVTLNGSTIFAPAAGTTAQITGTITGLAGLRLVGEGILSLTGANNFATALKSPGVTTGPSSALNGGVIIRSGTLHVGNSLALAGATVELGDAIPQVVTVDRATTSSMLLNGGIFNPLHDGQTLSDNGPGAFVGVSATIDGRYLGLVPTTAEPGTERFTGTLADGTALKFYGQTMPVGVQGDFIYYVRASSAGSFQVSASPGGAAVIFSDAGKNLFFIENDKLTTQILVKDQHENPEWNGVYRPIVTTDSRLLQVNSINFVRVAALDSVAEQQFGVRVVPQNGTSGGKAFMLASSVTDLNFSAVHWVEETPGGSVALLANIQGITIPNAVDVNAIPGSAASILGASSGITSGNAAFTGPITLQNLASSSVDAETLQVTSSTSTGLGVGISGTISEASVQDILTLNKTGAGVVTLGANNTFKGGVTVSQGTLLVMNTPVGASDSGTGSGLVTVNAGAVLGGLGSISGPVTLGGAAGTPAILRPGDPTSASVAVETLTINQPLTVGANSVIEFSLGAASMTKLAGTTLDLTTATSTMLVQFESGYNPADGTEFDILDFNAGGLSLFGGVTNLLNLLQLPVTKAWDTSQFLTSGVIKVTGDAVAAEVTSDPDDLTVQQRGSASFTFAYTGTNPVSIQWLKDGVEIQGATQQTLNISNVNQSHEGAYTVRVTNAVNAQAGGDVSQPAQLTVDWPLSFPEGGNLPTARRGSVGDPITFKVIVDGEATLAQPIRYEWQKNGVNIPGAPNSDTYIINPVVVGDAGVYRVRVYGPNLTSAPNQNTVPLVSADCTLTVSNGPAVVLESPVSRTVLVGSSITLNSLPGGDNNSRFMQWRRNGGAIAGERLSDLLIGNISLAQGGDYTIKVDNRVIATGKAASAISDPARVVVVENPSRIVAAQLGKSVKLTVNVGSPAGLKLGYKWLKNGADLPIGGRFVGGDTKTLTINALIAGDTDVYTCQVTGDRSTSVIGGTHFLRVYETSPELDVDKLDPADIPVGMVGGFYSWKVPVTSDVAATIGDPTPAAWKSTPATYAATGLPPGLRIDAATGFITGRPTAANPVKTPTGYPVRITVSNAIKAADLTKTTRNIIISIQPLRVGIAGVFAGPVQRHAIINSSLGGRFDMTVTATGAFSGSLTMGMDAARRFSGAFTLNLDANGVLIGAPTAVTVVLPGTTNAPPVSIDFTLGIVDAAVPGEPPVTILQGATIRYQSHSVGFTAWRNNFAARAVAGFSRLPTAYLNQTAPTPPAVPVLVPTLYNFAFTHALTENLNVPQGAGYATFTVSTSGGYSYVGRTADGEAITGAYWVGPTGQLFVFQTLYRTTPRGSLLGQLQIELGSSVNNNDISGNLDWVRPATPTATHRLYRAGFGLPGTPVITPITLTAFGGRFVEHSATTGTVFGPTAPVTANLEFSEDGEFSPVAADSDVTTSTNPDLIGITVNAGTKLVQPVITAATKITPVQKTGALSGTGTLVDGTLKRRLTFQGLMIRVRTSPLGEPRTEDYYGTGYFILDQIPNTTAVPPEKPTTSPQRSGIFSFQN
jgi:uncharacterized delta-60 repeat protein